MNSSKFNRQFWQQKLQDLVKNNRINPSFLKIFEDLIQTLESFTTDEKKAAIFNAYLNQVVQEFEKSSVFEPYHKSIDKNYRLGVDFCKCFVDEKNSEVLGLDNVQKIEKILSKNENVILFSNHQTEADPQ